MMKGRMLVDESMSNLTCASNEASISSNNNNKNEISIAFTHQSLASPSIIPAQPAKKKRNLPGNPDPEAEVISLSPRTLMATNRFVCEICNKGFQRDQNLQLHRRGHNLPWKLKQRTNKEVMIKKVYVCPEASCVHHEPSRALGDLTGIKKHYCRKHGEKKWKCEKCSKRYAVQSDWKAHTKICGTREYRCDCGTLFSRRDSFITHRAFCDALTQENARTTTITTTNTLLSSSSQPSTSIQPFPLKNEQHFHQISFNNLRPEMPPWLSSFPSTVEPAPSSSSQLFASRLDHPNIHHENPNPNHNPTLSSFQSPHMSATALLQKAAQMGVTMSKPCRPETIIRPHQAHMNATGLDSTLLDTSTAGYGLASYGNKAIITSATMENEAPPLLHHHHPNNFQESAFDDTFDDGMMNSKNESSFHEAFTESTGGGEEGMTRDFLGLRAFPTHHRDFFNMAGLDHIGAGASSSDDHQGNQNQPPWRS